MSKIMNVVSMSGGKDSTALALLAIALETPNLSFVFADTGHEHKLTYEYLEYLEDKLNITITRVRANFDFEIQRKREKLQAGKLPGWSDLATANALEVLHPTGNPFLDLCLWKGRFPSMKARFCTSDLKRDPIIEQIQMPILDRGDIVYSWQGIRRDESFARRYEKSFEAVGGGLYNFRPLVNWSVFSVFEAHEYMGIKPNPLYKMGMSRVGCMPCVNCSKSELQSIALRCPDEIARLRTWEHMVSKASRRQSATFFPSVTDPIKKNDIVINHKTHGIDNMISWSKTTHGGRQFDLIASTSSPEACKSAYGLCE